MPRLAPTAASTKVSRGLSTHEDQAAGNGARDPGVRRALPLPLPSAGAGPPSRTLPPSARPSLPGARLGRVGFGTLEHDSDRGGHRGRKRLPQSSAAASAESERSRDQPRPLIGSRARLSLRLGPTATQYPPQRRAEDPLLNERTSQRGATPLQVFFPRTIYWRGGLPLKRRTALIG